MGSWEGRVSGANEFAKPEFTKPDGWKEGTPEDDQIWVKRSWHQFGT